MAVHLRYRIRMILRCFVQYSVTMVGTGREFCRRGIEWLCLFMEITGPLQSQKAAVIFRFPAPVTNLSMCMYMVSFKGGI